MGKKEAVEEPAPEEKKDETPAEAPKDEEAAAGALKKAGAGLKVAGAKAAQVAGKAGVAVKAAGVAGGWMAYEGVRRAFNAFRDPGFVLFIAAALLFFVIQITQNSFIKILFSTVFLFYTTLFIFKGKGLLTVTIFWVWYIPFGAKTEPGFLISFLPIVGAILLLYGLFGHGRKALGQGFGEEVIGLIPILIFFLDLGAISFLTKSLNISITPLLKRLILFMPWWALFGLFTTKKENVFITTLKFAGMVYLFSLLVIGTIPDVGHYKSALPGPEELIQAKEKVSQQLPQKENPALSNLICIFTDPTNIEACVNKRQEDSEIKYICKETRQLKPGTTAYNDCLTEEKEKKKKAALQIAGTEDPSIKEPTKVEFKLSEYLKEPIVTYQPYYSFPINLEMKNPHEEKEASFVISLNCFFKKGSKNITGIINPNEITLLPKEEDTKSITCRPSEPLNGTYTLVYQATINNMVTASRLTRLFIGHPEQKTKQEIEELKQTYVPGKQYLSRAPKEFARINFGFGEPETNPIIEYDDQPLLVSTIENVGDGKILNINQYYINIDDYGITAPRECFAGGNVSLPQFKTTFGQTIPLTSCFVELPEDLKNPEDFLLREFSAYIVYDYQIKKEIRIQAKPGIVS